MKELKDNMLTKEDLERLEKLIKAIDPKEKTFNLTKEIINTNKKERFENKKEMRLK